MKTTTKGKQILFDAAQQNSDKGWRTVSDGVMGGVSEGNVSNNEDYMIFSGKVSTENNGGFAMVRHQIHTKEVKDLRTFLIRVKGDGKMYQFRIKSDKFQMHSYTCRFQTSGEWEDISIPFENMLPRFRGRSLELPEFDGEKVEEIAFLIGNKRDEDFVLRIGSVSAI